MQQDCILQDHQENYAENLSYFTLQYIDFIFHKHSESIQLFYIRSQYTLCVQSLEKKRSMYST